MNHYLILLELCYKGILVGMGIGSFLTCAAGVGLYKLYNDHCGHIQQHNDEEINLTGQDYDE